MPFLLEGRQKSFVRLDFTKHILSDRDVRLLTVATLQPEFYCSNFRICLGEGLDGIKMDLQ